MSSPFSKLLTDVEAGTLCAAHLPLGTRPVLHILPNATILIAGQAPSRRVHALGVPFDNASGDRLRDQSGITRDVFYAPHQIAILPMGLCYPGTGKSGDLPLRPECGLAWRTQLLAQLRQIRLTLVFGQYAQACHFGAGKKSLTELVQSWRTDCPGRVPLPHPSPRNNMWLRRNPWFESELLGPLRKQVAELLAQGLMFK